MKKSRMFLSIFFLLSCIYCSFLQAVTLHTIIVGDTRDASLRQVIKIDVKHMQAYFKAVAEMLEIDAHKPLTYTGYHVNADILKDLANLPIKKNDVVFFYFSGHGFHIPETDSLWPYVLLTSEGTGIHQLLITELLQQYHPRLIICMTDCCNNIVTENEWPNVIIKRMRPSKRDPRLVHLRTLFLETKGVILITSALPGLYSMGNDRRGSIFTNVFLKTFSDAISSKQPTVTWESILSKVQIRLWNTQQPQYLIEPN